MQGPEGHAIDEAIAMLDDGSLRVAEPRDGDWVTNAWVKSAILLYFRRRNRQIPLKSDYETAGVRCVAPGVARYGSFLGRNVILMPAFVNIGAYVGEGTMIDTWATVGSCAQIGANVHLSGGVGIGGVLEPPQASPVIVEDGAFIGSRCIIVEGVRVEREAVVGAGVVLTASTPILDVRGSEAVTTKGRIPSRAVVIPGYAAQALPRRRVRDALRADHRNAQRIDRSKNLAERNAARVRRRLMNPRVAEISPSLIRQVAAKRRPTSIDLGLGEPTLLPRREHLEEAMRYVGEHGLKYTPNAGDHALREAIARHYAYPGFDRAANVCVTVGSQEAMYVAIKALLDPARDELLVVEPAFPSYVKMAALEGVAVRRVEMSDEDDFAFDADRIAAALNERTRAIVICSPCNPTARVMARAQAERLVRVLEARGGDPVWVIHDEIYREQIFVDNPGFFAEIYPHTIVTNSVSKSNALTGLRLGWILGPSAFIDEAIKVHAWATSCADTFAQRAALAVFATPGGSAGAFRMVRRATRRASRGAERERSALRPAGRQLLRLRASTRRHELAASRDGPYRNPRRCGDSRHCLRRITRRLATPKLGRPIRTSPRRPPPHRHLLQHQALSVAPSLHACLSFAQRTTTVV